MLTAVLAVLAVCTAAGVGLAAHLLRVGDGRTDLPPLPRPDRGVPLVVHRAGMTWAEIGPPRRRHLCYAQTGLWIRTGEGAPVRWFERCPCGAGRYSGGRWQHRNSERRHRFGIGDDWPQIRAAGGRC